jgi:antitoxin component HigA of HigAB toxin-antitoxin module
MIIETEEENEILLEVVHQLMKKGSQNVTEQELRTIEVLGKAIQAFEEKMYPIG